MANELTNSEMLEEVFSRTRRIETRVTSHMKAFGIDPRSTQNVVDAGGLAYDAGLRTVFVTSPSVSLGDITTVLINVGAKGSIRIKLGTREWGTVDV